MMHTEEFQSLVLPHRALLTRAARGLTRNPEDAEDLVQETLLCAFTGLGSYTHRGCVTAWLRAILRNRFLNTYRKKTKEPQAVSLEAITDPNLCDHIACGSARDASTPSPEQSVLARMEAAAALRALAALPPAFRDVVVLADVDGLAYQEIAERLALPVSTVSTRLHRGRKRLQRTLFTWRAAGGLQGRDAARLDAASQSQSRVRRGRRVRPDDVRHLPMRSRTCSVLRIETTALCPRLLENLTGNSCKN